MSSYWTFILFALSCLVMIPLLDFIFRFFSFPKKGETKYFKDKQGRIVIYHGVNICNYSKWTPDNLPWHTVGDYQKLKEHGFNLVRFLIFWEALEPEKGKYNSDYIAKVKKHIAQLNDLGINVMLDLHQDLFHRKFNGDGFPDWALPPEEIPYKPNKIWFFNYFKKAVRSSYNNFWKASELKSRYASLVRYVKDEFNGCSNVIGLDVMNEPFPILSKLPWFEQTILSDFYLRIGIESLGNKINNFKNFYEPAIWCSAGIPTYVKAYTGGGYIPHYYPPFGNNPGSSYGWLSRFFTKYGLRSKSREAQKFNSPYIIGEFGISEGVENRIDGIEDFCTEADKYQMSWCWWTYDKENDSSMGLLDIAGKPNETMKVLSRPYPQKIAGTDPMYRIEEGQLYLEYTDDCGVEAPTEIFIPGKVISIKTNTFYHSNPFGGVCNGGVIKFYNRMKGKQVIKITWQYI